MDIHANIHWGPVHPSEAIEEEMLCCGQCGELLTEYDLPSTCLRCWQQTQTGEHIE